MIPPSILARIPPSAFAIALGAAIAIGCWLRLDQLAMQVLLEDEWHPVHQLIYYSPSRVLTSLGNADYSIPLVLLYFAMQRAFDLTELALRIPPVVAGIATVAVLPCLVRRRVGYRAASLFAVLLAISPILVSFSRIARAYALTLLGVYLAFWCLEQATRERGWRWPWAACYALLCGLVVWAHAITGPMLVAPLIVLWWSARGRDRRELTRLVGITLLTGACVALAVLPPLLGDPSALGTKGGMDQIAWGTVVGAWFLWLGTGSTALAWASLCLTVIGIRSVWACVALARWVIIGCLATVAVLAVAQPWWIDRSLALARYLLPLAPVVLLCISVGAIQCAEFAATRMRWHGTASNALVGAFVIALVATLWETGPFDELLRRPNSYTQHSYFQYDYRRETNLVRLGLALYPASGFWKTLAAKDAGSLTVAVAPFRYSTYEWPAPIWESESRQRVIPAFVWGTCEKQRHGEVPPAKGFHLANAVHLADAWSGFPQRVDYLAFYYGPRWPDVSPRMPHCEAWMRERLGAPAYEDGTLIAWHNPTLP